MTACSVIALLTASGAAGSAAGPLDSPSRQARELTASPRVAPDTAGAPKRLSGNQSRGRGKCPSAHRAVKFYAGRIAYWSGLMELTAPQHKVGQGCPRYLAKVLQRKAYALRKAYPKWRKRVWEHEYAWKEWLPRLWYAIGMCETGLNWQHNSGTYQGAFGFWYGTWDSYKPRGAPSEAYLATPRQQYEAALNVAARVGLNAWGCYSHGGYRYHM